VAYIELIFGTKVHFSGDIEKILLNKNEPALVISNHPTTTDWCFLWCWFSRFGNILKEKIVLKSSLRNLPGVGWAIQNENFLFLNRVWEKDEQHINHLLKYYQLLSSRPRSLSLPSPPTPKAIKIKTVSQRSSSIPSSSSSLSSTSSSSSSSSSSLYPFQLLLFPEGTDFHPAAVKKMQEFAKQNKLTPNKHVLFPRTTGFVHIVKRLRAQSVQALYDLTIAYPGAGPQAEDLVFGRYPKAVHFHVRRYLLSQLPENDDDLADWCKQRFVEKEIMLSKFHQNGYFEDRLDQIPDLSKTPDIRGNLWFWLSFWTVFVLTSLYLLYLSSYVRYSFVSACLFYLVMSRFLPLDTLIPRLYRFYRPVKTD